MKVKSLYIEGDLWYVGSDNGLHISENAGVTWITKTTNDGLAHVKIKSILKLNSRLLVGTDGGLCVSDDNGQTWINKWFGDSEDFNKVKAIRLINNAIWVATDAGIWILDKDCLETRKYIGTNAGLSNIKVKVLATNTNEDMILAGTDGGLGASFDGGVSWTMYDRDLASLKVKALLVNNNEVWLGHDGGLTRYKFY